MMACPSAAAGPFRLETAAAAELRAAQDDLLVGQQLDGPADGRAFHGQRGRDFDLGHHDQVFEVELAVQGGEDTPRLQAQIPIRGDKKGWQSWLPA
jgi:hypothetical protein